MADFYSSDNTKEGGGKWLIRKSGYVGTLEDNRRAAQIKTVGHLATQKSIEKMNTPTKDGVKTDRVR